MVFDFHQIVDGLKEVELGGSRLVNIPVFALIIIHKSVSLIVSVQRRKGLAQLTLEKHLAPVCVFITYLITKHLPSNSASSSKVVSNGMDTLNTIPKGKLSATRLATFLFSIYLILIFSDNLS